LAFFKESDMLPIGTQFANPLKRALAQGRKCLGAWLQLCNSMSAEIFARSGFDFLVIDLEHAPGDFLNLLGQLHAMGKYPATPLVRAPWNDFVTIKRILDVGVHGIHVPYVNTAEEAREAARAVRYAPEGIRGIAGSPRACGYGLDGKNYYSHANREILMYVALETPQAVENLDAMMKVEGVDGIFIGPMDLAASLGHLGDPGHAEVQKVIRSIEAKVIGSGKFLGTVAGGYEAAKELFGRGYQYVVAMSDSIELAKQSKAMVDAFRKDNP
jgi:2-dehydro-3-deoxyglucarate aldolase/4-hydroxy-2-oxoheptanedioate aldolase